MKTTHVTRLLVALFASFAVNSSAIDMPWEFRDRLCEHPFRRVGERICDLRPLFAWTRAGGAARYGSGPNPMTPWGGFLNYEVLYQNSEHILCQRVTLREFDQKIIDRDPQIIVLKNFPHETRDGATISFIATPAGIVTVPDRFGVPHRHQCYDYGKPLSPEETRAHIATLATK